MPIIKSAAKRVKQSEKRRQQNVLTKKNLRMATRALEDALSSGATMKKMTDLLNDVNSAYDTTVKKNLIHKNKAARKKSYYSGLVKGGSKKTTKKSAS